MYFRAPQPFSSAQNCAVLFSKEGWCFAGTATVAHRQSKVRMAEHRPLRFVRFITRSPGYGTVSVNCHTPGKLQKHPVNKTVSFRTGDKNQKRKGATAASELSTPLGQFVLEFRFAEDSFLSMLLEVKSLVFGACGGSQQDNRPQKRVFREKLVLVTRRVHKRGQQKRLGLDIGSCQILPKMYGVGGNQTTFLDGQTLKRVHFTNIAVESRIFCKLVTKCVSTTFQCLLVVSHQSQFTKRQGSVSVHSTNKKAPLKTFPGTNKSVCARRGRGKWVSLQSLMQYRIPTSHCCNSNSNSDRSTC